HHDAAVVGERRGDDDRRHSRSRHHVRPRPRVREPRRPRVLTAGQATAHVRRALTRFDVLRRFRVALPLPVNRRVNPPNDLTITLENAAATTALVYPASKNDRASTLILAHGAGAGQRSAFMVNVARAIASLGVRVVTFNFLYIE